VKDLFGQITPVLLILILGASSFAYLNCSSSLEKKPVSANDLGKIHQLKIDDLTPAEVKRLEVIINREVSPCGNDYSLAETILNPNLCPLSVHGVQYVLSLLKQDYNVEEISEMYVARYSSVKGLKIPVNGSPVWGAEKASITIVVFSDFECPFCAKAAQIIDKIAASYPDDIAVMHKDFPLEDIHPNAMLGARAGYAAGKQGKFKEMHDLLYSTGRTGYSPDKVQTMAIGLGLDIDRFEDDLASDGALAAIRADIDLGQKLGVHGTPSIFVNGRILEGGVSGLSERINEEFMRLQFSKK
jgi:protein-disulfide isomerase